MDLSSINSVQSYLAKSARSAEESVRAEILSPEAIEKRRLEQSQREVMAEQIRQSQIAGSYARPIAEFAHELGPDGSRYAVDVTLSFDTSVAGEEPEELLEKAETVRRAALASSDPNTQELMVAAKAAMMATMARARMLKGGEEQAGIALQAASAKTPHSYQQMESAGATALLFSQSA